MSNVKSQRINMEYVNLMKLKNKLEYCYIEHQ
ncbi:hypothetical protein YPC_1351 [Yersinia pestis biovar Medievalis str. Harbin 35]|nr:hypothetical protein YPC_1351 [Yersinia pestis biovar Medievalis str. Harbin 35]EEO77809.1 hypothetical protein YP516_1496 [Yersinia pestis Nepal516]EEO79663.1 hypothetical protein YPF_3652 [Yersinia pestis biovar Orientalis str. India 195]EEO85035.1 hypothetical protein YPH_0873 [Yersinia pestis biovar Orientalis str. PEXU2]EEO89522.1 hypothetical protein YPS_3487 [Yersinia pestis Pestoides A]